MKSVAQLIEMNPVRASIVRTAAELPWSSFRANAYGEASPLIEQIRRATNGGFVLGDSAYRNSVARTLGRRVAPSAPGRRPRSNAEDDRAELAGWE